ncbi:DUF4382 domain-containing protein [Sulfurovum sp. CS9]|uniref:DUF4382 domain-containing protein n=1 Tax=Sulfurovum sp. CS9 TaxID=3391146 RepID=UPI0039E88017
MKQIKMLLLASMVILFTACGGGSSSDGTAPSATTSGSTPTATTPDSTSSAKTETGVMSLSITDAPPQLPGTVTAVYITVTGIEFNYDGNWMDVNDFEFENDEFEKNKFESQTFDLLALHDGESLYLGDIVLPVGHYKEIRFKLDAPEKNGKVKSNPGCYIEFGEDEPIAPLFVPSGGQSGYKGKGDFDITANAKIKIMADFNVEKSIVVAGNSGKYLLKPVIRLVVTELSGTINGTVVDIETFNKENDDLFVYAYEAGTYDSTYPEDDEMVPNSDGSHFLNSISSTDVNMSDGNFTLSFLEEGAYDLVTVNYPVDVEGTDPIVVDVEKGDDGKGVIVSKATETPVDVNTSDYPPL